MLSNSRYENLKKVARDCTGEIYSAFDTKKEIEVRLKRFIVVEESEGTRKWTRLFIDYAQKLKELKHDGLLPIVEAGLDDDGIFVAYKQRASITWEAQMGNGKLTGAQVIQIATPLLGGLAKAHHFKVYHGAMSAQSILLMREANGSLIGVFSDVGLYHIGELAHQGDTSLELHYDPRFTAPETFETHELSAKADLYALGQILMTCLLGYCPYDGLDYNDAKAKHQSGEKPDIREAGIRVSDELITWIEKMVATDPADRFTSAKEALKELPEESNEPSYVPPIKPTPKPVQPEGTPQPAPTPHGQTAPNIHQAQPPASPHQIPTPVPHPGTVSGQQPEDGPQINLAPKPPTGQVTAAAPLTATTRTQLVSSSRPSTNTSSVSTLPSLRSSQSEVKVSNKSTQVIIFGIIGIVLIGLIIVVFVM